MSDPGTRLAAALQADAPPARDGVFRIEVLVRLEQARFRRRVRRTAVLATLLAVFAGINMPAIGAWIATDDSRILFVALGAASAIFLLSAVMMVPRLRAAVTTVGRLLYP